jgi:hypothetical protein
MHRRPPDGVVLDRSLAVTVAVIMQVGVKEGVVLLTYSSLISAADSGSSRIQQIVDWCGPGFDGLVVFDGALLP